MLSGSSHAPRIHFGDFFQEGMKLIAPESISGALFNCGQDEIEAHPQ
jgi:hypothetical protein